MAKLKQETHKKAQVSPPKYNSWMENFKNNDWFKNFKSFETALTPFK